MMRVLHRNNIIPGVFVVLWAAFDSLETCIRFHVQPRLWGEPRFVTRRDELGA